VSSPTQPPGSYGGGSTGLYPAAPGSTTSGPAAGPMGSLDGDRSLGELISGITTDLSTLVQQEIALAKAEATQSAKRAGKGAGMFGGAGFAGYFVLLFLSIALWWAIGDGMGHGWSALIVAVLWAIVGLVLYLRGRKEFADVRGLDRTTETLGKIPNAVKGNEEDNR
jgi:hypothetical protein